MTVPGDLTKPSRAAFTVAELVFVLVIISIIAALAVPRYANAVARYRAELSAARIAADLTFARRYAKFNSTDLKIGFDAAADSYELSGVPDPDDGSPDYVVQLSEEPYGADLVSADVGTDGFLWFNGFGLPDGAATIRVQVGTYGSQVTVDAATGRVTVE